MITIQGFAKLCGCNTQTLRYYDRIGLLPPARVDEWTGYRYYEEEQALRFVKIKNLQQADFSIDEIRPLLDGENDRLMEAFARKIAEQEQKLEQIRKIQQSYLAEKMEMQEMLNMLADFMEGRKDDPKLWEEFGLDAAQNAAAKAKVQEILTEWFAEIRAASREIAQQANSREHDAMKAVMQALREGGQGKQNWIVSVTGAGGENEEEIPADAEKLFERSCWAHVREWLDSLPQLDGGKRYFFQFKVREDSPVYDPGFPTMLLAVVASRYEVLEGGVNCRVGRSDDGKNRVVVLRQ